jgi:hypothetical protein
MTSSLTVLKAVISRVSFDCGSLEIVGPRRAHEVSARLIEALMRILSEELDFNLQSYGSVTWKSKKLSKGAEADGCYYAKNAHDVRGKLEFDLEPTRRLTLWLRSI